MPLDEIKKVYKKLAMQKHPDKIGAMNLPKIVEKKAIADFNQIQEAYELIVNSRKK
jgi:curved DNA-binding protein CbpA